jgi:Hypothetical protein RSc1605
MNALPPARIDIAQRTNLGLLTDLTVRTLEGLEALVELNLQTTKASLAESIDKAHQALAVKGVHELLALQAGLMQPVGEHILSYHHRLYDIARAVQAEFATATGAEFEAHNRRAKALVDNLKRNAPPGSDAAVRVLASVITAINQWREMLYTTATQAADIAEMSAVRTEASQAARPAPSAATS